MLLVIRGELTSLNEYINAERTNRFRAAKIKKEETERIYYECKEQKLQRIRGAKKAVFTWFSKNERKDFDNIEFAQKFIWDGLVMAGVLLSDTQKDTPKVRIHNHEIDKKKPRIELEFI